MQMQLGYSFIHLFSIRSFSSAQSCRVAGFFANFHPQSFILFSFDGFLIQPSSRPHGNKSSLLQRRGEHGTQAATTHETLSSSHLLFALVRYFPAVVQPGRRALVKAKWREMRIRRRSRCLCLAYAFSSWGRARGWQIYRAQTTNYPPQENGCSPLWSCLLHPL